MSISNNSSPNISLQKSNGLPPDLPPTDDYGQLLPQLLSEPRAGRASWGVSWITNALSIFKDNFLLWLGIGVVYLIIAMVMSAIPIINFVFSLISFVFVGGIIKGANAQVTGKELRFDHLFSAFSTHLLPLIVLFVLYMVALIIAFIPIAIVLFAIVYSTGDMGNVNSVVTGEQMGGGSIVAILLVLLFSMIAFFFLFVMVWFAPALIVLHNIAPTEAMKMSVKGCLKNIMPLFVFSLLLPILALLSILFTLGLAILVVVPIGMITYYTSYRDVWTDQPLSDV
ncbi:BPSS1780 family membrane protein [Psychrobacter sp. AOP22-C1-C5]|uniref:BPSS1780 family membrane protein n=1 Tax=Psychrobacter sp. AOP22-C1-C5 TaxID=3457716 RepID=UPI004035AEA2